ncbi:MAG TPA: ABC transporter substrate-binding protein [Solirubrobacteraceae bacterium]|jgi:ABC-type nitrate/sulfonate/bicarbonate transport system substrate-binding protein|nr:ABC transporter substrate-binding protein [Solirubrobacteraceae bacterium]
MKFLKRPAQISGWAKVVAAASVASLSIVAILATSTAASAKASLVTLKLTGPANPPPGVKPDPAGFPGYAIYLGKANKALAPYGFKYGGYIAFENTTQADAAVQSGSADIVAQGQAPAILAKAGGDNLTVIGGVAVPDTTAVVVPANSPITSIKQLAGKTVGAGFGTNFEQGFLWALKNAGVNPSSVHLANIVVNVGNAALQNSTDGIAAFAASTQLSQLWATENDGFKTIWASQNYPADKAAQVSLVNSNYAKAHPGVQEAWWALYQAGLTAYKKNPTAYFKWVGQQDGITAAQAKIAAPVVIQTTPIEPNVVPVLKSGLTFFLQVGQAQKSFNVNSWLIAPAGKIKTPKK